MELLLYFSVVAVLTTSLALGLNALGCSEDIEIVPEQAQALLEKRFPNIAINEKRMMSNAMLFSVDRETLGVVRALGCNLVAIRLSNHDIRDITLKSDGLVIRTTHYAHPHIVISTSEPEGLKGWLHELLNSKESPVVSRAPSQ